MTKIVRMVPNAVHASEFDKASNGQTHNGTCTQTSAEDCLTSALNLDPSHQAVIDRMTAMTDDMYAKNLCAQNGAATVANMALYMTTYRGATIFKQYNYTEPLSNAVNWQQLVIDNAGIRPILLQVARASNAYDIYGNHFNAGVQYHAIALMGYCDDGSIVVSDPNNPGVDRDFDVYPMQALINMVPCGMIITEVKKVMTVPQGWNQTNGVLTNPVNSYVVRGGFENLVLSGNWDAESVPLQNEQTFGNIVRQRFLKDVLYADLNVGSVWVGDPREEIKERTIDDSNAINSVQSQLAAANNQIADLKNQLAAAKSTPPTSGGLTPTDQAKIDAANALIVALANVQKAGQ